MDKYNNLKEYFALLIEIEEFFSLDDAKKECLQSYIDNYYTSIIDLFDGLDKMVKEYISCGNISGAKKIIYDRFSDESLEYDLQTCSDKNLYREVFLKLKQVYMVLINNYQDNNIQKECYNKISYILNSLQNQRKNALYGMNIKNKNDVIKNIELSLIRIKSSFDENTLNMLENIELLVQKVISLQTSPNIKSTRAAVLNKIATGKEFKPFGILNNRIVVLINSCSENNYKTYVYNKNAMDIYKSIYGDILSFVYDNINSLEGKEYFKKLIVNNLSNFILYDSQNDVTSVNIVNLKKLFDLVSNVMLIEELSMFEDINFHKLEKFDMGGFKSAISEMKKTNSSQEQLEEIALTYELELRNHNSSISVLNLFRHK